MRRMWVLAALGAASAAAQLRHRRRIASDPARAELEIPPSGRELTIRSGDDTRLHVEVFGPEDGQTVVLVHGWTENASFWTYTIRDLANRGFRVVVPELRGHGRSGAAAERDYAVGRFGDDVAAVLEQCVPDGDRAVIAGHSLGAMAIVAWAEHAEVRGRIGAAALINTGVGDLLTQQLLVPVPKFGQALNKLIAVRGFLGSRVPLPRVSTPLGHLLIRYLAFGPAASPAQIALYERMITTCPADARASTGIGMSELELHHALPRLTVPTLVIAGELDRLTPPSHARRVAGLLPALEGLIILPATAHMAPLERPQEVNEALAALAASAREPHAVTPSAPA